ncbi:MAG: mechanosensitive ion channel, partial [Gemmatimonadota bacterium]
MILQTPTTQVSEAADTVATSFGRFWTDLLGRGDVWFDLALSAAVLLVIVLLRRLLLKVLDRHVEDVRLRYRWAKGTAYGAFIVVALLIVVIWTDGNLASLGTFLGLLTAGLAIALRDLVANVAGWLFILWRRPFDVGDRVQ